MRCHYTTDDIGQNVQRAGGQSGQALGFEKYVARILLRIRLQRQTLALGQIFENRTFGRIRWNIIVPFHCINNILLTIFTPCRGIARRRHDVRYTYDVRTSARERGRRQVDSGHGEHVDIVHENGVRKKLRKHDSLENNSRRRSVLIRPYNSTFLKRFETFRRTSRIS